MTELENSKTDTQPAPVVANETDNTEEEDEENFDWDEYLIKTNSEQVPWTCFAQNSQTPINEFKVGQKLETNDPRNTSSICLASIIEIAGPRLRLRLDGTDDRNDFWLMCDSDLIHPFEYSTKHGRKIQPPLGYGNDLSKWPKFLEKIVNNSHLNNVFAPENCFKQPPIKPSKNEFKIGQKLEAVDPKNPHLICPATIKDVNRDKILISFDGWSNSSQFWIHFTSRDLFPCGWCKKTGHVLQQPGDLEEPKIKSKNRSTIKPAKVGTKKKNSQNESLNDSLNNSNLITETVQSTPILDKKKVEQNETFDLSLVKSEPIDPDNSVNKTNINSKGNRGVTLTFHVRSGFDCGKFVNSTKFHKAHTKFGPGPVSNIYKSILQSFIDCAVDRSQVFELIPKGTGTQFVSFKTSSSSDKKRINFVKDVQELWVEIKKVCDILGIDESNLFSVKPFTDADKIPNIQTPQPIENKENLIKEKNIEKIQEFPLTPQASTCSNTTSPLSNDQNLLKLATSKFNNGLNKRRLSNDNENIQRKINKTDTIPSNLESKECHNQSSSNLILKVNEWTIDQVVEYIHSLGDYFKGHVDAFKHHEIDGKALLLLTTDILMKYMGFKLGPALKLNNFLDKLRVNQAGSSSVNGQQQLKSEKTFNC